MLKLLNKWHFFNFIVFTVVLFLSACNSRPNGVMNESKMTDVLTEMHKLDGSISEKGIQYGHYPEKKKYYQFVLKKYEITEAEFDSSIVWYTQNPKKFLKIYTNVLLALNEFEAEVKTGKFHPEDSVEKANSKLEIWNKKTSYRFTKDSTRTKLAFEITSANFMLGDAYVLKFLHRISPKDASKNPHIIIRINYFSEKSDSAYIKTYNDSLLRRYNIRIPVVRKSKIKSITGELLGSSEFKGKFNASLDSISLVRKFNFFKQDSLRKVVEKADSMVLQKKVKLKTDSIKKINSKNVITKKRDLKPVNK